MAVSHERSLFDSPVGDFDWGPPQRMRRLVGVIAPAVLAASGLALLVVVGLRLLWA